MRRLLSLLLTIAALVSLSACSDGKLSFKPGGSKDGIIEPDDDGVAFGQVNDTLRTAFFDMTVENPHTADEFDGLTPDAGYQFLLADLTLYNYTSYDQTMYDDDFNVLWPVGEGDDVGLDGDWPVYKEITDENGNASYTTKSDKQMPIQFTLYIQETRTELLLFQVPKDVREFYIAFRELVDDGTEEGEWGDVFYVQVDL